MMFMNIPRVSEIYKGPYVQSWRWRSGGLYDPTQVNRFLTKGADNWCIHYG